MSLCTLKPGAAADELRPKAFRCGRRYWPAPAPSCTAAVLHAWPTELALQMQVLRDALQQAAQPLSAAQAAARFRRVRPEKGEPLLATLAALSLVRQTAEGGM